MKNSVYKKLYERISKIEGTDTQYIKNQDLLKLKLPGEKRPIFGYGELVNFQCEVVGYIAVKNKLGKRKIYYDIWPSSGYHQGIILWLIPISIIFFLLATAMIGSTSSDIGCGITAGILFGIFTSFVFYIWSIYAEAAGVKNQENKLLKILTENLGEIDSIERKTNDKLKIDWRGDDYEHEIITELKNIWKRDNRKIKKGKINYFKSSEMFLCPYCKNEFKIVRKKHPIKTKCPYCGVRGEIQ